MSDARTEARTGVVAAKAGGATSPSPAVELTGARTVKEFQETEMVIAPSIKTEGKMQQRDQKVGMGA